MVFIHRTYCLTYSSQADAMIDDVLASPVLKRVVLWQALHFVGLPYAKNDGAKASRVGRFRDANSSDKTPYVQAAPG
jgi:hypothetical protein